MTTMVEGLFTYDSSYYLGDLASEYRNCVLMRDFLPYKKGTVIDLIVIDLSEVTMDFLDKGDHFLSSFKLKISVKEKSQGSLTHD